MKLAITWFTLLTFCCDRLSAQHQQAKIDNCLVRQKRLTCFQHLPDDASGVEISKKIKVLELNNVEWDVVDVNTILDKFPEIEAISIVGGNISKFISPDPGVKNNIKVLELKNVGVENIGTSFLANYPNLETLNLEGNLLQSLKDNFTSKNLKNLYLLDNKWNCSMDLDWVHSLHHDIVKDIHNLTCFGEPHNGKPLLAIAHFIKDMKKDCPEICYCSLPKVVRNPESEHFEPIIEVNCSHRNLYDLPDDLPHKTKILKLNNNEISNLRALKHNPKYKKILDLYLDNNQINSIDTLEGSYWLRHFRVFSLSGNKISELPTYALDNALQQNTNMPNAVRITLGGNPWRCDCVFTPVFQEMLRKFAPQIQDISKVKCSYVEGDENSLLPIIDLSRSSVCRSPSEYSIQALDLLNGVLASLILLVLGKLAYDYYYFKKTGRLPWIVTKMP